MTEIKFKPIFPSPLGFANFGNSNKQLNKDLIDDIEDHMKELKVVVEHLKRMSHHGNLNLVLKINMRVYLEVFY